MRELTKSEEDAFSLGQMNGFEMIIKRLRRQAGIDFAYDRDGSASALRAFARNLENELKGMQQSHDDRFH